MPPDRSHRAVHSFSSGIIGSPRPLSHQPSLRNNDTYGSASTSAAGPDGEFSRIGRIDGTLATIDVPPAVNLNQPLSESNQSSQLFMSAPQHRNQHLIRQSLRPEVNDLVLLQTTRPLFSAPIPYGHMQPHPTESANQHNPQYYTPYHRAHSDRRYLQGEGTLQPTASLEQKCLHPPHQSSNETAFRLQDTSSGFFNQAHDFIVKDSILVNNSSDNFMASLLETTIIGAEFDSSDRNMPLRCHPGTRLKIIKRCQDFILNRDGRPKLRWVVGAAGVGKSAIMQSVAHDEFDVLSGIIVGATIFFSVNGRQDGTKAITTICYQLAVKLNSYRLFVQREVTRDPTLLRKSLPRQFKKFIVEPFIHQRILDRSNRLLIIIDGLDECADTSVQKELLGLISYFCITYPTSPIVWMIASRPEPHITSFFSQPKVALAYEKEEILVDSDEACEDVKRYLRDKFGEVQMTSITHQQLPQWPSEGDFLKIASASGGLFAYASTVVRYISDPDYGDPVPLLDDVLEIIEKGTKENIWGRNHPMAQLDALYSHIMSKIPANVLANTRKLLLLTNWKGEGIAISFQLLSNILGMAQNTAYGATHHIRSVANVPGPARAIMTPLRFFHKSFPDYLRDFERSGFSPNFDSEADQLMYHAVLKILEQAPDGVCVDYIFDGTLKDGPGTGEKISVPWPATTSGHHNIDLRRDIFRQAILTLMKGFRSGEEALQSPLCVHVLTTCFTDLPYNFPFNAMQDFVFDECRRRELLEQGILRQVLLLAIHYDAAAVDLPIRLRFRGRIVEHSNPWNILCRHEREGSWEGHSQDWSTEFARPGRSALSPTCHHCFKRFTHHFKLQPLDHVVTVLNLARTLRLVELRFIDPSDGVSDWTYHFFIRKDHQQPCQQH